MAPRGRARQRLRAASAIVFASAVLLLGAVSPVQWSKARRWQEDSSWGSAPGFSARRALVAGDILLVSSATSASPADATSSGGLLRAPNASTTAAPAAAMAAAAGADGAASSVVAATAVAAAAEEEEEKEASERCEEIYGVLPCSDSITGNLFLMLAYGYLVLVAAQLISDGSELLLQVLNPGLIGGLLLPVLGAFPDAALITVSGLSGSKADAQESVLVGMGVLAGSTIMILTVTWAGSLVAGRCDLEEKPAVGLVAKDRTLTRPWWDVARTGVTVDEQTRVGAWVMMMTLAPFVVMQIPLMDGGNEGIQGRIAALVGLVLSLAGLVAYCTYQVVSPWLQESRMEYARLHYIRTLALRDLHNLAKAHTWGALVNPDGHPNLETLNKVFMHFDTDQSGTLSRTELRALILGLGIRQGAVPEEEEINAWMREFDVNSDGEIERLEFLKGMGKWMSHVTTKKLLNDVVNEAGTALGAGGQPLRTASGIVDAFWDRHAHAAHNQLELLKDEIGGAQEDGDDDDNEDEEEEEVPKTPFQIIRSAVVLIFGGAVLVTVFADPVVDSITNFSQASGIPAFFVAFVAAPLASNASEVISSLAFALKKRKRTISLTYSQVYGAISMNNTLCLGVFLALVYFRNLRWEFSAEVVIILLNVLLVGYLGGSKRTFPTWVALVVLMLYPLSLGIVLYLDFVLGWS